MKRPTKKIQEKLIIEAEVLNEFDIDKFFTPDELRGVADVMESEEFLRVGLIDISGCGDMYVERQAYRMETVSEAEERYGKEKILYDNWKKRAERNKQARKVRLAEEAEAMGLKLVKK